MSQKTKITVIEGQSEVRNLIQGFLSSKGYDVEIASSNESALQTYSNPNSKTDLVIVDAVGSMNFVSQFRKSQPQTPILVLTSNDTVEAALDGVRAGAFYYLNRQFKLVDLSLLIELSLKQSRLQHEVQNLKSQAGGVGAESQQSDQQAIFADFPTLDELEKRYMKIVLEKTKGRKEKAARILGINRRTLYRKEREYGWVEASSAQNPPDLPIQGKITPGPDSGVEH